MKGIVRAFTLPDELRLPGASFVMENSATKYFYYKLKKSTRFEKSARFEGNVFEWIGEHSLVATLEVESWMRILSVHNSHYQPCDARNCDAKLFLNSPPW